MLCKCFRRVFSGLLAEDNTEYELLNETEALIKMLRHPQDNHAIYILDATLDPRAYGRGNLMREINIFLTRKTNRLDVYTSQPTLDKYAGSSEHPLLSLIEREHISGRNRAIVEVANLHDQGARILSTHGATYFKPHDSRDQGYYKANDPEMYAALFYNWQKLNIPGF